MRITVKLFAIVRDRAGQSELAIDMPEGGDVAAARAALLQRLPSLSGLLDRVAFAVNRSYVAADSILHDGDELAVIPPVSGG
jgi:molybdopterin converting factor subunit 1